MEKAKKVLKEIAKIAGWVVALAEFLYANISTGA